MKLQVLQIPDTPVDQPAGCPGRTGTEVFGIHDRCLPPSGGGLSGNSQAVNATANDENVDRRQGLGSFILTIVHLLTYVIHR
jgi:hypothetical protein